MRSEVKRMVTLVGQSQQIEEVRDLIEKVAPLDIQVLITGETGTGKDVVARMIHEKSRRNKGPFVPVNCGAIPDSLMESALFGHEKGAFTGATGRTKGFFEEAFGGTLFLDEISEGSLAFQTALLRVLQEEIFFKIGSTRQQKADCRIVAATNKDLRSQVSKGAFREDLYFRLNIFEIKMPPLRDRAEDILFLAEYFLKKISRKYRKDVLGLSREVKAIFNSYHWPGNVRELFHVLERALIVESTSILTPDSLPKYLRDRIGPVPLPEKHGSLMYCEDDLARELIYHLPITEAKRRFERMYLERLLSKTRGNISLAANVAGIRRQNLYRKLEQLNIDPARFRKRARKGKKDGPVR